MNSPPRPSRDSPPRRAALHERSDSHTNERVSPTLRIIGNPQAQIYASSPFPTKPSQVLSPKVYDGQGSTFGPGVGASNDREPQGETRDDLENTLTTATSYSRPRSGDISDVFNTPMQATAQGADISTNFLAMDEGIDNDTTRVSDEIVQLPSVSPGLGSSEVYGTANPRDASHRRPVLQDSDGSLSSSNSTGTVIVKKTRDGRKRASYSAFPNTARPGSSKSNISLSTPQKPATGDTGGRDTSASPISPSSPASPGYAMPRDRRISSVPLYASSQNSVNLQYPVIRPPSASASWYVYFEIIISFVVFTWVAQNVPRSTKPILLPMSIFFSDCCRTRPIFLCHIRLDSMESKRFWGVSYHGLVAFKTPAT